MIYLTMKIHLIKRETIEEYMITQARSRPSFEEWLEKMKAADWQIPEDIKRTFNSADLLGNGSYRVVFNIAGNNFRMIAKYWFGTSKVHLYINGSALMRNIQPYVKKNYNIRWMIINGIIWKH